VLHHVTENGPRYLRYLFIEGQAAVMLFFILSGFVIYYSSYKIRNTDSFTFKDYFIRRFRRIYPVFIIALIITYVSKSIDYGRMVKFDGYSLFGNLLNLQDISRIPGNWFGPYNANTPLWSLSYEWWFYIMFFPIFMYIKPVSQKYVALIISVLGFVTFCFYPNKISITCEYFVIWWSGVEIARSWLLTHKLDQRTIKFLVISYGTMIALLVTQVVFFNGKLKIQQHPIIELRHYGYAVILIIMGIAWRRLRFIGYKYVLKPFAIFAPISYGVYVFHFPIMEKYDVLKLDNKWLSYAITFGIVVALAYLVEVVLQNKINKLTNKYLNKKPN
jgi:peptidoglycan/LPS O-acetylase OafA/YrhL